MPPTVVKISMRGVIWCFAASIFGSIQIACLSGCSYLNTNVGLPNASAPLMTPTYDGSGQATEPSVRFFSNAWNGFRYWAVINPFPENDSSKENPSILNSNDGMSWQVPIGLKNPIALPSVGHLADGELFYDILSDQLWVYYLWEDDANNTHVMRQISSDGVSWSAPKDLLSVPNYTLESPTFARFDEQYWMWSVNASSSGCNALTTSVEYRTSRDGINWSSPQVATLSQTGFTIWHIEVIEVPSLSELWMLLAAYPKGETCANTVLFFAKSSDATRWRSYSKPVLTTGPSWDSGEIYRSAGSFDPEFNLMRIWYSARRGPVWHIGYTQGNYSEVLSTLLQ